MASSVIRNYTVKVDKRKKKSTFTLYPYPVEVLTPNGWVNIEEELKSIMEKGHNDAYFMTSQEKTLFAEYSDLITTFREPRIASQIILDTDDPSGIEIVSRERVQHVLEAEKRAEIPFGREFAYVHGASNISGVIVLPDDDYSDVYVVSDADNDGVAELTYIQTKEETGGVRPYYEKVDGQTFIYVNHFSGGGGTQADPYIVSTEEDLNNVRNKLNGWYRQDRDIVMGSFQTGAGFTPIGTTTTPWLGVYDGDGYSIKSLYVNTTVAYTGLFGYSEGGYVCNLRLIDPNITSSMTCVGAFVGGGYNIKLDNCNVIGGFVQGGGTVGGLVGRNYGDTRQSTGVKTGTGYMRYCYNLNCTVRTSGNYAGGVYGHIQDLYYGNIITQYIYSTGLVEDITVAKDKVGINGLIGYNPTGWGATASFWDMEKSKRYSDAFAGTTGLSTADMRNPSTFVDWDLKNYWYMNGEEYNNGYPEHRQFVRYRVGKGTAAEPFIITTERDVEQMRWWRRGYYFKFEDDVKMISNQTGSGFYPLGHGLAGKEHVPNFAAFVDGGGRCVANLFIYRTTTDTVGLFGNVDGGEIKNLDIIDPDVTGADYPSAFGYFLGVSKARNCHVDTFNGGKIAGNGGVGGFTGCTAGSALIEDCSANILVSGKGYVGGFVGYMRGNSIFRRCYSSGKGESTGAYLGGFFAMSDANSAVLVEDCFSNKELNGTHVGAFGGYHNRYSAGTIVRRCVAYGKVYGSTVAGGFLAAIADYERPSWAENYFDKSLNPGTSFGAVGKFTAEMKHPSTYLGVGWDFVTTWTLSEKFNNGYPVLTALRPLDPPILGFRNEFGKYYTDNSGGILRYLDFGTLVASMTSLPKAVWVQNNADFAVNNLKVWIDALTVKPGMYPELSIAETPFLGSQDITFNGTFSKGMAGKFFVRLGSDISVKEGGTFDLRAKASPV